jgi:hypothetical protein
LDGLGFAVAPRFETAPAPDSNALRSLKSNKVRTVRPPSREPFVGIAAPSKAGLSRWFDLSAELPVLRTFANSPADAGPAGAWSHGDVIEPYDDAELQKIFEFLSQAIAAPSE